MEILIIVLISCVIWALICYKIAENRGRSKWLAFGLGFLFGFFALIGYLIAGESKERKAETIAQAIKKSQE